MSNSLPTLPPMNKSTLCTEVLTLLYADREYQHGGESEQDVVERLARENRDARLTRFKRESDDA